MQPVSSVSILTVLTALAGCAPASAARTVPEPAAVQLVNGGWNRVLEVPGTEVVRLSATRDSGMFLAANVRGQTASRIFRSLDGGRGWSEVAVHPAHLRAAHPVSRSEVYLLPAGVRGRPLRWTEGEGFREVAVPPEVGGGQVEEDVVQTRGLLDLSGDERRLYAVGTYGLVLGGTQGRLQAERTPLPAGGRLSRIPSLRTVAAAGEFALAGGDVLLWRSPTGWRRISLPPGPCAPERLVVTPPVGYAGGGACLSRWRDGRWEDLSALVGGGRIIGASGGASCGVFWTDAGGLLVVTSGRVARGSFPGAPSGAAVSGRDLVVAVQGAAGIELHHTRLSPGQPITC